MHFVSRRGAPDIGLPGVTVNNLIMALPAKRGNALLESIMRAMKRQIMPRQAIARAGNPARALVTMAT
jgi:hypothetical protein